ncbi:hypothetical protein PQR63_01945 [Herbaspirillum rhizosphaerae]|uniref:SacI restriction endonuclease n=1 Tax=Herbaspirillum rhizosphaerae TaxID=346179 RepID=A0ABW8Z457_9BURK
MTPDQRNIKAKKFVSEWLIKGRDFSPPAEVMATLSEAQRVLTDLIPIKSKGFRGVVLTAIVGMELDPTYSPLIDFYDCNPRAIFEQGIFYALQDALIPCGKSDPLNVAKNIQKLDYDWARRRRPESAAMAVVNYLKLLDKARDNPTHYTNLLLLYFHELYLYGQYVKSLYVPMQQNTNTAPLEMGEKFAKFTTDCPEGGSVPQFIVGHLLNLLREHDLKVATVEGYEESVFGTNTTSKKPADIWEVLTDGTIGTLYEVTVKQIDKKRLDDIVDATIGQTWEDRPVTFICNLPRDITSLGILKPFITYREKHFQFLDIQHFVRITYSLLNDEQRVRFNAFVDVFVSDVNRDVATKQYWSTNFS